MQQAFYPRPIGVFFLSEPLIADGFATDSLPWVGQSLFPGWRSPRFFFALLQGFCSGPLTRGYLRGSEDRRILNGFQIEELAPSTDRYGQFGNNGIHSVVIALQTFMKVTFPVRMEFYTLPNIRLRTVLLPIRYPGWRGPRVF